jgi:hypothetical protein
MGNKQNKVLPRVNDGPSDLVLLIPGVILDFSKLYFFVQARSFCIEIYHTYYSSNICVHPISSPQQS